MLYKYPQSGYTDYGREVPIELCKTFLIDCEIWNKSFIAFSIIQLVNKLDIDEYLPLDTI